MADYNIYIHTDTEDNPTKPKENKDSNTKPKDSKKNKNFIANFKDIKKLALKAAPVVAVIAVAKVTDKAISVVEPFISRQSGDYRFNIGYNNFKGVMKSVFDPIGTGLKYAESLQNAAIQEQKLEQSRQLLGDSVINELGGYKI